MKRLTLQTAVVMILFLTFICANSALAATRYVNGQDGNDNWDGSQRVHIPNTTIGPKETINAAIEICSATGDKVVIDYADGFLYPLADPGDAGMLNPTLQMTKQIEFSAEGGKVKVDEWMIYANTVFSGDYQFQINTQLTLTSGNVTGGDMLQMANGARVWRTLGAITTGQLTFAGLCDFTYDTGARVVTGLEMPESTNTSVIRDIQTLPNTSTSNPTNLVLSEDKTMNGIIDLDGGSIPAPADSEFDLGGFVLTVVGSETHNNFTDIINGLLSFNLNGTARLDGNLPVLPNVDANLSGTLEIATGGSIGVITANNTAHVDIEDAGSASFPIGGLVNNGTGTIDLQRSGDIWLDFDDTVDFADPDASTHWVKAFNGLIHFSHSAGVAGTVHIGHLELNGDAPTEIRFPSSANDVIIHGNVNFVKGEWNMPGNAAPRRLQLAGALSRFGEEGNNADFSATGTLGIPVDLFVQPLVGTIIEQQTINGNKPNSIWHGTMTVDNTVAADPALTLHGGHFRVLDDVAFLNGQVKVDTTVIFSIGNEITPTGAGDFLNESGFVGAYGGYIAMNGNAQQMISGTGDFGDFAVNNASGVEVIGPSAVTMVQSLYLTKGELDNTSTQQIDFDNSSTPPRIVILNGRLTGTPNFVTMVDVEYQGNEKDYRTFALDQIYELPSVNNADPLGEKLHSLIINTQNNTFCANDHGWVRINDDITINGTLEIAAGQSLIVNDSRTITLNTGGVFDIKGYLFTRANAVLALGGSGGFDITIDGYLPNIQVNPGSYNNRVQAKGLRVSSMPTNNPGLDFFCDFDVNMAALETFTKGNITFLPNVTPGDSSHLAVNFTDTDFGHFANLTTDEQATFELASNIMQTGVLVHGDMAKMHLGEYVYADSGLVAEIHGSSITTSTTGKLQFVEDNMTSLLLVQGPGFEDPVIDANVEIALDAAGTVFWLDTASSADSLFLNGDLTLTRGTVQLGSNLGVDPKHLHLQGKNFIMQADGTVIGDGTLFWNSATPPLMVSIFSNPPTIPSLRNLTIKDDVELVVDVGNVDSNLDVTGNFFHENGLLNFAATDITIKNTGQYVRDEGTYAATTGYLVLQTNAVDVGVYGTSTDFTIPNLRVQAGATVPVGGKTDLKFTVTERFDLFNGLGANQFQHAGRMNFADGVLLTFQDGSFDEAPTFGGTIDLLAVHQRNLTMPAVVWPGTPTSLVNVFSVECDPATSGWQLTLPGSRTVNQTFNLTHGDVVVPGDSTFAVTDDDTINVVDGRLILNGNATTDYGTGIHVYYYNNAAGYVTGPELPAEVASLLFSRYVNFPNTWTTVTSEVRVTGSNTLTIRNNVETNAKIIVECDVHIENESDVFPLATDPICAFWEPLEFAGSKEQNIYVPSGRVIDLTNGGTAPANILINKASPQNLVTLRGGDIRTGTIFFVTGMLDTEANNTIIIPAPWPGFGQGFEGASNRSHVIGNIAKHFTNSGAPNTSTNSRSEFPVGNGEFYRPMAITFNPSTNGYPTIPNETQISVAHVNAFPQGKVFDDPSLQDAIEAGRDVSAYPGFYWDVRTNMTLSQKVFDVELKANGFDSTKYADVDDLRIIRRHGSRQEIDNPWLLQGSPSDYDNAQYLAGPTVISRNSIGGLRSEGALFTLGLEYGELPESSPFVRVWDGNPKDPMILYVTGAKFPTGYDLAIGDEIAVYDDGTCVGVGVLQNDLSSTDPLLIYCDEWQDLGGGSARTATFQLWDQSESTLYSSNTPTYYSIVDNTEISAPQFGANESYRVELNTVNGHETQHITLNQGWNIVSFAVDPVGDPNILLNPDGNMGIFSPVESVLEKITGDGGLSIEKLFTSPDWLIYGDPTWFKTEGYYVKMKQDTVLAVSGAPMDSTLAIPLDAGWNLISYPLFSQQQDVRTVFDELITQGFLLKVMNEEGRPFEYLAFFGDWQNHIGNMIPGEGYYVKVNAPCTLTVNGSLGGVPKVLAAETREPEHFVMDKYNPYKPMSVYVGEAAINTLELAEGDEIAVYNKNQLVGAAMVNDAVSKENPLVIALAKDDGSKIGFEQGDALSFKIWHSASQNEIAVNAADITFMNVDDGKQVGSTGFKELGSIMVGLAAQTDLEIVPTAFELKQNYPNPFNPKTTISFALPQSGQVKVEVYDITGKFVTTLVNQEHSAGSHTIEWNGINAQGNLVASGVYFYKMTAPGFSQTRKMIFTK